eukprot:309593-Rhodomonas_salina.1
MAVANCAENRSIQAPCHQITSAISSPSTSFLPPAGARGHDKTPCGTPRACPAGVAAVVARKHSKRFWALGRHASA